eukprot:gene15741-21862_t
MTTAKTNVKTMGQQEKTGNMNRDDNCQVKCQDKWSDIPDTSIGGHDGIAAVLQQRYKGAVVVGGQQRYKGSVVVGGQATEQAGVFISQAETILATEQAGVFMIPGGDQTISEEPGRRFEYKSSEARYIGLAICTKRDSTPSLQSPPSGHPMAAAFALKGLAPLSMTERGPEGTQEVLRTKVWYNLGLRPNYDLSEGNLGPPRIWELGEPLAAELDSEMHALQAMQALGVPNFTMGAL